MSTKFTNDHEWARLEGDLVTVGITDYAQKQLGEVVFVELPEVGKSVESGDEVAVVESVKAAGEVKAPLGGEVVEINETLADAPEKVNEDPAGEGWFYRLKPTDPAALDKLLDQDAYDALLASLD